MASPSGGLHGTLASRGTTREDGGIRWQTEHGRGPPTAFYVGMRDRLWDAALGPEVCSVEYSLALEHLSGPVEAVIDDPATGDGS